MGARQAVLPIPSKPSGPTQLLFYKQNASVSPLFAALTSRPQPAENTATLSPLLATLTTSLPVTPVFATLTKTAGVSLPLFPFWKSPRATRFPRPSPARSPLPLCFHTLTNSLAGLKFTTPLFSCNSKLLPKNTRGGVYYLFPQTGARRVPNLCALRVSAFRFLVRLLPLFRLNTPKRKIPSFIFNSLRTLLQLGGGGGYPRPPGGHHPPLLHRVLRTIPGNPVGREARQPHHKVDSIPYRHQPQLPPQNLVANAPNAHGPGHHQPKHQIRQQIRPADTPRRGHNRRQHRPGQPMRENQPQIGRRPAQPHRPRPAHLMVPEPAHSLRRIHRPHRLARKDHPAAGLGNAVPQLIVVREHVGKALETANLRQPWFRRDNRRAQRKRDPLHPLRHQHSREKIARSADGLDLRPKIFLGDSAIKRSHRSGLFARQWCHHFPQIIGPHAHVAVGQHQNLVPRLARQAGQLGHFAVRPRLLRANRQANRSRRKFLNHPLDQRHRRVRRVVHPKKNLVLRIILPAKAREILVRTKIQAPHRLQQAYRRRIIRQCLSPLAPEKPHRGQASQRVVSQRRSGHKQHNHPPTSVQMHHSGDNPLLLVPNLIPEISKQASVVGAQHCCAPVEEASNSRVFRVETPESKANNSKVNAADQQSKQIPYSPFACIMCRRMAVKMACVENKCARSMCCIFSDGTIRQRSASAFRRPPANPVSAIVFAPNSRATCSPRTTFSELPLPEIARTRSSFSARSRNCSAKISP